MNIKKIINFKDIDWAENGIEHFFFRNKKEGEFANFYGYLIIGRAFGNEDVIAIELRFFSIVCFKYINDISTIELTDNDLKIYDMSQGINDAPHIHIRSDKIQALYLGKYKLNDETRDDMKIIERILELENNHDSLEEIEYEN